jgi:hypothetical protein
MNIVVSAEDVNRTPAATELTPELWRLRVGTTTADDEIRCSPNQLQKPQLKQFGTTALLGSTFG